MVISGVMATIATTPKASVVTSPPNALHAPMASGNRNVAVIGPLATPPESKAMAVKIGGVKNVSTAAIRYPGTNRYIIGIPTTIRIIASATEMATPMDRLVLKAFAGIAPAVISNTCLFST